MILTRTGDSINTEFGTFFVGHRVAANSTAGEYEGLTGSITEIRTGRDRDTENSTEDIYVCFEEPTDPALIQRLEADFSDSYGEPKTIDDIALDEVIMAPAMLTPLPTPVKRPAKPRLYVAYGSNLNVEQMAHRCPTAEVVGTAVLNNRQLLFRGERGGGVATVEKFKGDTVPVLVWSIRPMDERALDIYEGWPKQYRKETVRIKLDGKTVSAMIYIMNAGQPRNSPGNYYFNTIRTGYIRAGFDVSILIAAARNSREEVIPMTDTVREQILAVRATGLANMIDVTAVQRIAYDNDFYELVCFIEDDRKAYVNFILTGKTS